jgi:hypothetical protein
LLGPINLIQEKDIETLHEADEKLKSIKKDLTIGTAKILGAAPGFLDKIASTIQAVISPVKDPTDILGDAKLINRDAQAVSAPLFDLKGRPLTGPKAKPIPEPKPKETKANIAAQSITLKDMEKTEKLRDDLANKIYQNSLKQMTVLEKQAALKKEILELEANAAQLGTLGLMDEMLEAQIKAEDLRGQLKTDHKAERMDFTSAEKIGAFANVSALHSAGMDHAASTAQHTAKMAQDLSALLQYAKGYTRDPKNDRAKRTHDAVHFG